MVKFNLIDFRVLIILLLTKYPHMTKADLLTSNNILKSNRHSYIKQTNITSSLKLLLYWIIREGLYSPTATNIQSVHVNSHSVDPYK